MIFASSRPLAPPAPAHIDAITAGDPIDNFAIGCFTLRRETFGAEALHARITVANFSPKPSEVTVTVSGDDKQLATARTSLGRARDRRRRVSLARSRQHLQGRLSPSDGFSLDNIAYATAGSVKSVSILFVSPHPADAQGLEYDSGRDGRDQIARCVYARRI